MLIEHGLFSFLSSTGFQGNTLEQIKSSTEQSCKEMRQSRRQINGTEMLRYRQQVRTKIAGLILTEADQTLLICSEGYGQHKKPVLADAQTSQAILSSLSSSLLLLQPPLCLPFRQQRRAHIFTYTRIRNHG